MKILQLISRFALTVILLYFVYQETGWATTLVLALIVLAIEIQAKIDEVHTEILKKMVEG